MNERIKKDQEAFEQKMRARASVLAARSLAAEKAKKGKASELKVFSNFQCNGIDAKVGEVLTVDQVRILGDSVSDLKKHGCIGAGDVAPKAAQVQRVEKSQAIVVSRGDDLDEENDGDV